ncbi:MAG: nitrate reductase [Methylomonas sp.]|nr:MAG: nitrate reductase [Methylomonas sp.]
MTATKQVQTTCPYCGVGCGIDAVVDEPNRQIKIQGDKAHPANFGRLCSKGSALGETIELNSRLLEPVVYGQQATWSEALDLVADSFANAVKTYGPEAVAIYGSGQLLTEDYYVANKLMKGFIGSANMDTNSRLCMSSSVAGHKRAFGSDTVPGCYEDYELADMMVLIGSNTAWCHPVSFQRIRAAKDANPALKIVVIDPRRTVTCDIADLHLPLASGSDGFLFNGLLKFLAEHNVLNQAYIDQHTEGFAAAIAAANRFSVEAVAQHCLLDAADVAQFYHWFAGHEKVLSLYSQGINQSSSGTDKVDAIINCHLATGRIGKPGMGPFSLTGQPNAMGGREVGGLAHQLAAHMDFSNAGDIDRVARFWNSPNIAQKPGLPAVELFDAVYDGKIKALWIMGTNPVVSLPNADKIKQALKRCDFVAVSDCIANTDTGVFAHVLLPAQGWSEKDGTVTNSERCISRQRALLDAAGSAMPDWWILTQVARRLGFEEAFHYKKPVEIFREHAALSGFENDEVHGLRDFDISGYAHISDAAYDALQPAQWPVNRLYPKGRARIFDDGKYFTASGKAQFIAVTPQTPINLPDAEFPLVLNTGRLRDQWHTMTRTTIAAKLNQHKPEPFVEVHPDDAARYGLEAQALAQLETRWGAMLARVDIATGQKPGNVFVPMHWTEQFASWGRMGALVNPVFDPISKQPESKHTPVRIQPYRAAWYGFVLSRHELDLKGPEYVVKVKGNQFYRYELAGQSIPESWQDWFAKTVGESLLDTWFCQEYHDAAKGNYRAACLEGDRLQAVFFASAEVNLPERGWLTGLFEKPGLQVNECRALLTGLPPVGEADVGTIVCACFNVGKKTIAAAIKEKSLKTHQEVGQCLKAGTNCGSCIPEIKALL